MTRRLAATVIVAGVALLVVGCSDDASVSTTTTDSPSITSTTTADTATTADTTTTSLATTTTAGPTTTTTTIPLDEVSIRLVEVESGFDNPVLLVAAPDGGADLVVEQRGRVVRADGGAHEVVLDIRDDVRFAGEQGLLGFAVHPDFAANNLVYVNYINLENNTVIEQFSMINGRIDVASRVPILTIAQPDSNHNGGMVAFGPDGYLWIGMGDGGGSRDGYGNGQNPGTLLATMLRISVAGGVSPYGIPPDNPFADGQDGQPEIWAIGLRNPWRFAFDGETLWIADVGEADLEEVNVVAASEGGLNYGWSIMEGSECFRSPTCSTEGFVVPITEYGHLDGCSITGGYVYRGSRIPSLSGQYFFSDYCTGLMRSISSHGIGRDWSDMVGPFGNPTGFGIGSDGELFVVTKQGSLFTFEEAGNG